MRFRFLGLLLLLCAAGCGGSGTAPVSGRVTLDGQPLANATVIFQPQGSGANPGPASEGKTDANGNYTLRLVNKDVAGAIVGKHKVTISAPKGDPSESNANPKPREERVPGMYNSESKLTFDVPAGGSNAANFELKSK